MSNEITGEDVRDFMAQDNEDITEGADNYGVIALVVEESEMSLDAHCIYETDFRDDADDRTAAAFAEALSQTVPQLLLELALYKATEGER